MSAEMSNFLSGKRSTCFYGNDNTGHYLKAGRKWCTTRKAKPLPITMSLDIAPQFKSRFFQKSGNKFDEEPTNKN